MMRIDALQWVLAATVRDASHNLVIGPARDFAPGSHLFICRPYVKSKLRQWCQGIESWEEAVNTPLRVCHLGKYYPPAPGGIESHVQTIARAQSAGGLAVRVVCVNHTNHEGRDLTYVRHGATDTVHHRDGDIDVTRVGRSASFARLDVCPGLPKLLREITRDDTDVIHVHTPNPTMLLALAGARPAVPLVITHHSDIIRQRILKLALRPFEYFVYGKAAAIQSTSPEYPSESSLLRRYQDRVESLPLGVDLNAFTHPTPAAVAFGEQLRAEHGDPIWLAVGRCVYYKSFDVAIRGLPHVKGKLMIVGHGPLEPQLKQLAKDLGVADRVIWKHYLSPDELVGTYRAATALWFPSSARSEAFGLVQVEAMACGTPVINARISGSGVPWVCPHDLTGLTIAVNDHAALAAAANRLLNEGGLRARLSRAAADRARREFDHTVMAQRSVSVYERALARERREQSTWSWGRPMLKSFWPAPEFRRPRLQEVVADQQHAGFAA
jgi:glycosyltransferase involved in cell wall biosynthesis